MAARKKSNSKESKPATQPSAGNSVPPKVKSVNSARGAVETKTSSKPKAGKPSAVEAAAGHPKREVQEKAAAAAKPAAPAKAAPGPASATPGTVKAQSQAKSVEVKSVSAPAATAPQPVAPVAAAPAAKAPVASSDVGSTATQRPSQPPAQPKGAATAKAVKAPIPAKLEREENSGEQKNMKTGANRHGFKLNEFVVYPAHGVGQIVSVEEQEVAGFKLELFVISFVKDKMTLRVPTQKVVGVGMRKLSDADSAKRSLDILTGRARIKRTMWSRRAQEYEAKINSGDINAIAEVVRDLYRSEAQPEQSYSERQLYEAALDRMMREIAVVHKLSETEAIKLIETQLKKNVKRGAKPDAIEGEEGEIEEAA